MSFDGGKVVQVTPTHAIVRPQAWHGDEGLDVHVPHKNIKEEAIVEGGNYGKPYNNDEDLKSKSNKELQSLHNFWKTRIDKDPNHSRAKGQLAKIKAILAGKIGKKMKEEVEQIDEANVEYNQQAHSGYSRAIKPGTKIGVTVNPTSRNSHRGMSNIQPATVVDYHGKDDDGQHQYTVRQNGKTRKITSRSAVIRTIKKPSTNEEVELDEAKDKGEYDYEGDMAMSQLKSVIANAQKLHDMLKPDTNLPEWVQSKITLAEDYIVTATNYMDGELNEGLVSAIKRAFTPKPKSTEDQIANFRAKTKARTQQNLGDAAKRKPKPYSVRLSDAGRKPESRSEYDANREMTKENYAIAAKQSQSFKTFRGGVKGKGTGSRRTQTNQVADHVKIYKESTND
jgi:hypothetical protein